VAAVVLRFRFGLRLPTTCSSEFALSVEPRRGREINNKRIQLDRAI
jgi:hypothetical protein